MYLLGFSVNNLTLLALTVATGFVVDDSIVMIENIARHVEEGRSPFDAALIGSRQIGFTILSLTISLIAVLIPLLFMGDVIGRLFREFAVTLGLAIIVSAGVSLSLAPMLCARLLRRNAGDEANSFERRSDRKFDVVVRLYARFSIACSKRQGTGAPGDGGDARRRRSSLRRHSERLLPGPGHGSRLRRLGRAGRRLFRGDGRSPAGARAAHSRGS